MQVKQNIILPPAIIGIIGGGQLGRMFSICASQMGYKVALLEPAIDFPAKNFIDFHINTSYDDIDGLSRLAKMATVITTEFENVPNQPLKQIEQYCKIFPNYKQLAVAQNRKLEKAFFNKIGVPTTKYIIIEVNSPNFSIKPSTLHQLKKQQNEIFPAILKTTTLGYDGKGQVRVDNLIELEAKLRDLCKTAPQVVESSNSDSNHPDNKIFCSHHEFILEKKVSLFKEASIVVAANNSGIELSPIIENQHHNGILDISLAPAKIEQQLKQQIKEYALLVVQHLDYIGVLTIEFFITTAKEILVNEMAPRPHNSGHLTIDACHTSQFEQQVRAICGLKLGKFNLHSEAIMLNILGNMYNNDGQLHNLEYILTNYPNLKLHMYQKNEARSGRKMGHITLLGNSATSHRTETQPPAKNSINVAPLINDKISTASLIDQAKNIKQLLLGRNSSNQSK